MRWVLWRGVEVSKVNAGLELVLMIGAGSARSSQGSYEAGVQTEGGIEWGGFGQNREQEHSTLESERNGA